MASSGLINLNKYKEAFKQTSNAIQKTISGQNNQDVITESFDVLSGVAQAGAQAVGAVAQTAVNMAQTGLESYAKTLSTTMFTPEQTEKAAKSYMNFLAGAPGNTEKLVNDFIGGLRDAGVPASVGEEQDYLSELGTYIFDNVQKLEKTTQKLVTGGYGTTLSTLDVGNMAIDYMNPADDLLVPGIVDLNTVPDKVVNASLDSSTQALLNSDDEIMRKIGAVMAGTRETVQFSVYAPQYALNGSRSLLNDMYTDTLSSWNTLKGVNKNGQHKGGNYVSIGDSVQSGWGFEDYQKYGTYVVANKNVKGSTPMLVGEGLGGKTTQLHMPGLTTSEVLYMLTDTPDWKLDAGLFKDVSDGQYSREQLDANKQLYRESIKNADVITLDIGFNDIWAGWVTPFYELFSDFKNEDITLLDQFLKSPEYVSHFIDGYIGGGLMGLSYYVNYPLILYEIYKLNPDATVVLCGGYNPQEGWDIDDLIPGVDIDDNIMSYGFGLYWEFRDLWKRALAFAYPGECVYADMSGTEINMGQAKIGGISQNENGFNPHPTEEGAIEMSTRILKALGQKPITNKSYNQREIANNFVREFANRVIDTAGGATPTIQREVENVSGAVMTGDTDRMASQAGTSAAKVTTEVAKDAKNFYDSYEKTGYKGIEESRKTGVRSNNTPSMIDDINNWMNKINNKK